jgi:hypothetical protein
MKHEAQITSLITALVEEHGATTVAAMLGVNPSHVYNVTGGKRRPSPTLVRALKVAGIMPGFRKRMVRGVEFTRAEDAAAWDRMRQKTGLGRKGFGLLLVRLLEAHLA